MPKSAPPPTLLAASAQRQHQVKHRPAFDVVVLRSPVIAHLLPAENQPLLDRGDPLLLLQAFLDALDAVTRLDVDFNLLARQGLHLDHLRRDENEKGDTEKDEAEDVSTWAPGGG
eukprot:CAMPEP_0119209378 /NCGR_PEP_ID=MMETSP1327-20130426/1420_1 /TAXON_ID=38833 /ORGANISM="Micromonas pusilla, Strain RCC2306" /LENGTH=114 /DNA_ID=CAMNT_0007206195 /DNA_START=56 /DNA_END=400 /DNA_ORIENTATION=-